MSDNGVMTMKGGKGFVATGQAATSLDLAKAYNMNIDNLRQITQVILNNDDGSTSIFQVLLPPWAPKSCQPAAVCVARQSTGQHCLQLPLCLTCSGIPQAGAF